MLNPQRLYEMAEESRFMVAITVPMIFIDDNGKLSLVPNYSANLIVKVGSN